jgi:hypothetical protein
MIIATIIRIITRFLSSKKNQDPGQGQRRVGA